MTIAESWSAYQASLPAVAAAKAQLETLESEMTEHTPGPWWTDAQYDGREMGCAIVAANTDRGPMPGNPTRGMVAFATELINTRARECEANARLISAAPDMLKALRRAQRVLSMTQVDGTSEFMKEIEAAISKAQPDDMESDDA